MEMAFKDHVVPTPWYGRDQVILDAHMILVNF